MPSTSFNSEEQQGRYDVYGCQSNYEFDSGVIAMPVAGPPGTPPEVVQLHAGVGHRRVRSTGRRFGKLPTLPDPFAPPAGQVLEGYAVNLAAAELDTDGVSHVYEAGGDYSYILTAQPTPAAGFAFATQPFDSTGAAANVMDSQAFSGALFPTAAQAAAQVVADQDLAAQRAGADALAAQGVVGIQRTPPPGTFPQ